VVFQDRLPSHLCYTSEDISQIQTRVKLNRVFFPRWFCQARSLGCVGLDKRGDKLPRLSFMAANGVAWQGEAIDPSGVAKDTKPSLIPISIFILPSSYLSAQNISCLKQYGFMASICQIFRRWPDNPAPAITTCNGLLGRLQTAQLPNNAF